MKKETGNKPLPIIIETKSLKEIKSHPLQGLTYCHECAKMKKEVYNLISNYYICKSCLETKRV